MSLKFLDIITEGKERCEYQVRDIGGNSYYKKCGKDKKWSFTDEIDFLKNSNRNNTIQWEKPKEKKSKVRQIEVPQKKGNKIEDLKIYYTNLSPNGYEVMVEKGKIIIIPD